MVFQVELINIVAMFGYRKSTLVGFCYYIYDTTARLNFQVVAIIYDCRIH